MLQHIIAAALDKMMDEGYPLEEAAEIAVDEVTNAPHRDRTLLADTIRALKMVMEPVL